MKPVHCILLLAVLVAVSLAAKLPLVALKEISVRNEIPAFDCTGKTGYYADLYRNCHVFYRCEPDGSKWAFACPLELLFSDPAQACMPKADVICPDPYI